MRYRVIFSLEADAHLTNIYRHIAENASIEIARRFTDAVVDYCEAFDTFHDEALSATTCGRDCGSWDSVVGSPSLSQSKKVS